MQSVSAPALASILDRHATDWSPATLREIFLRHGCAVIRGLISQDRLRDLKGFIAEAYAKTEGLHVYDHDLIDISNGRVSGFELVDTPLVDSFLDLIYSGQEWTQDSVTTRRIDGVADNHGWQKPLDLHLDCEFHKFQFTTNFWIPLDECGVEAPCLQMVPLDYLSTRRYSGYRGYRLHANKDRHTGFFRDGIFHPENIESHFGLECFFRPIMQPGDAILASNWLIHGSHRTSEMKKGRTSVEVRFIGKKEDVAMPHLPLSQQLINRVSIYRRLLHQSRRLAPFMTHLR
jgi:hypothetical protein